MIGVWISLAVSVAAVAVTGVRTGRQGWATFKDSRRFTGALGRELRVLNEKTAQIERSAAAVETRSAELQRSLARLEDSRRRLGVLRSAVDDVEATLGRLTFFFPRK
jgi:hypothetical protein